MFGWTYAFEWRLEVDVIREATQRQGRRFPRLINTKKNFDSDNDDSM